MLFLSNRKSGNAMEISPMSHPNQNPGDTFANKCVRFLLSYKGVMFQEFIGECWKYLWTTNSSTDRGYWSSWARVRIQIRTRIEPAPLIFLPNRTLTWKLFKILRNFNEPELSSKKYTNSRPWFFMYSYNVTCNKVMYIHIVQ